MSDLKLYDVVPEWSPERKEAYVLYRDFGPDRSYAAVAQALGKSKTLIDRWGGEDKWQIRVAAWDAEQDRQRQEAAQEEARRLAKKHARAIEDTITVLMQPAMRLAAMIEEGDESLTKDTDPITLANLAAQAGKQLPALVQASRLVHGQSTDNVAVKSDHRVAIEGADVNTLDAYLVGVDDGAQHLLEAGEDDEIIDADVVS